MAMTTIKVALTGEEAWNAILAQFRGRYETDRKDTGYEGQNAESCEFCC